MFYSRFVVLTTSVCFLHKCIQRYKGIYKKISKSHSVIFGGLWGESKFCLYNLDERQFNCFGWRTFGFWTQLVRPSFLRQKDVIRLKQDWLQGWWEKTCKIEKNKNRMDESEDGTYEESSSISTSTKTTIPTLKMFWWSNKTTDRLNRPTNSCKIWKV